MSEDRGSSVLRYTLKRSMQPARKLGSHVSTAQCPCATDLQREQMQEEEIGGESQRQEGRQHMQPRMVEKKGS